MAPASKPSRQNSLRFDKAPRFTHICIKSKELPMFALAYVILPFSETAPADAIQSSLARFQRGLPGDVPDSWIEFEDYTEFLRSAHEAEFIFSLSQNGGLRIQADNDAASVIDFDKVRAEMQQRKQDRWSVRFADSMDIETFHDKFCHQQDRNSAGSFGAFRNGLGRWDWWDLGGRFDGCIVGDQRRAKGRGVTKLQSPGASRGRTILGNLEKVLAGALGHAPAPTFDIRSDRNVELVSTLLADGRAGAEHAIPGALVLPPGAVEDRLRWLDNWPEQGPAEGISWLGLPADATWSDVVIAAYARFQDHWAAGVAYHF
jgi:hypothetical protein